MTDPIAEGVKLVPYHFERLAKHVQHCIDNFYGTEHTPQFNWAEWKDIHAALTAAGEMAGERPNIAVTEKMKWAGLNALDNTEFGEKDLGHKFGYAAMGEIFRAMLAAAPAAPASPLGEDVVMVKRKDVETWAECLDAMARGAGGWAWEDVHDEMLAAIGRT